jgi:cell division protease FtsH
MLDPVVLRRNRRICQDYALRSHLLASERLAAFLSATTGADYRTAFKMVAALPRTETIRHLRKSRLETRKRRLGSFAGLVQQGRLRLHTDEGFSPRRPDLAAPSRGSASAQPGHAEARDYLLRVTRSQDRKLETLLARAAGAENDSQSAWAIRPTPEQAIHALMIVQLAQALAASGRNIARLSPDPGTVIAITVPRLEDRKAMAMVLAELLPRGKKLSAVLLEDTSRVSRLEEYHSKIEAELLLGQGVIALLGGAHPLPSRLTPLVCSNLWLPAISADTLTQLFGILHPHSSFCLAELDLSRISYTLLLPALAAPDAETAKAKLTRVLASTAPRENTTLDAVHGQAEAVATLQQTVSDLENWQAGRLHWPDVTHSFLLYGPPGTGKTLLAQALAGSAQVPLIKTSYSECQLAGHQGDMLRALYAAGEQAILSAPSVFFIDEIDSFFGRDRPGNNGYIIGVVNGLLTLIDRVLSTPGVILIAATNDRSRVDPAVVRAGRFDRHIAVGLPDRAGIVAMLRAGLPAPLAHDGFDTIGDQLLGLSGAEIAALLRDARTRARGAGRALSLDDLVAAADAAVPRHGQDTLWQIAVHEAGHLLAGHLLGLASPIRARITARGGFVARPAEMMLSPSSIPSQIQVRLAGRVAEGLLCREISTGGGAGAESDLARATQLAVEAEVNFGFGPTLTWYALDRPLTHLPPDIQGRVEARLQEAHRDITALLDMHRTDLQRIATALLAERDLDANALARLLKTVSQPAHAPPIDYKTSM